MASFDLSDSNHPCAVSIHWRIRCHMNTVHKTDSVLPSDRMLIFSHSGHTALTQGMIRDSRSVSVVDRLSAPPATRTDAYDLLLRLSGWQWRHTVLIRELPDLSFASCSMPSFRFLLGMELDNFEPQMANVELIIQKISQFFPIDTCQHGSHAISLPLLHPEHLL